MPTSGAPTWRSTLRRGRSAEPAGRTRWTSTWRDQHVFGGPIQDKAHLEEPDRALEILRAVLANDIVDPYLGALDPVFDSLVFLSPTEVAVAYQVGPSYHWEIGRILLIDGHWRVALGTMCRDLMDAACTCADVVADPRPGPLG